MVKKFYSGGTLGDAFIIACKLYDYHKKTGERVELVRYSSHAELDDAISRLFYYFPYIKVTSIHCKNVYEVINRLKECSKENLINVRADGQAHIGASFMKDPNYITMEPYPQLNITQYPKGNKFRIGIQIQSGKPKGNFKMFSVRWIKKLISFLNNDNRYEVFITGKSFGYKKQIDIICEKFSVNNFVAKTSFNEWLSLMKSFDFFVTPEGFPAFFSMSQKVKTLAFYTDYQILGRIHPEWRKENILISAGWMDLRSRVYNKIFRTIFGRNPLLNPIKPEQVYSIIQAQ